jgi:phenylacetate-CoA ligase
MSVQCEGTGLDQAAIAETLSAILKLKGRVEVVAENTIPRDGIVIEDRRTYET